MPLSRTLKLAFRFSLREMRGGLSGFLIFLACIALGVAAIGGVNSVARAITAGVANEGQSLLGGDLRFQLNQRAATQAEHVFLDGLGTVSHSANMRSMARLDDGSDQALVEAKAVDGAYPLYGALETQPVLAKQELFGEQSGVFGAAAPDLLFERLNLRIGDRLKLGSATFELRARLVNEPDAVSDGFGFAPRLMISTDGLAASGLIQPGSLVENAYKVRLPGGTGEARIKAIQDQAAENFPESGWSIRTRSNAAPALSANIERFSQFLTLVGLTALVVGGVGVANAVRAYLDGKRGVIATFKSLGASGGFVFAVYLVQILMIAALGITLGVALGALMPFAASAALQSIIPVPAEGGFYPGALGMAALFGLLVTLAFALLPLGRARDVPATALFREMGFESRGFPRPLYTAAALGIALLLAALAILFSGDRYIASIFVGATIFAFLVLRLVGALVQWAAKRSPTRWLDGAQARHRQHPSAGRLDAVGGAVAGTGADASGDAGADRRQSQAADFRQPAGTGAELLLRRHPEQRCRCVLGAGRQGGAARHAGQGADAARPGDGAERRRRRQGQGAGGRAPGCCAAIAG